MNSDSQRMRAFFSPALINKLVGIMHCMSTAVKTFHCIPDINLIDSAAAAEDANVHKSTLMDEDQEDEMKETKLPKLSDAKDWAPFKEAFLQMLSATYGARKMPLSCLVDTTTRTSLRASVPIEEIDALDLAEEHIFEKKTAHFGTTFKQDNTLLWNKLKNELLDKLGCNHISQFS